MMQAEAVAVPRSRGRPPGARDEPGARSPLPWLPGFRLHHAGEFVLPGDASPALPARSRVALRVHGEFTGATVLEVSQSAGRTWSPILRDGRPIVLAAPGALCVAALLLGAAPAFARARCLSLTAGVVRWSLSSW